jgi:hypothetical protein
MSNAIRSVTVLVSLVLAIGSEGCSAGPSDPESELSEQVQALAPFTFACGYYTVVYDGTGYTVVRNGWNVAASVVNMNDGTHQCTRTITPDSRPKTQSSLGGARVVIGCQDQANVITGSVGTDIICGGPFDDTIRGNGSADFINGMGGNDVIFGGTGRDWLRGGKGADAISGDIDYDCVYGDLDFDTTISGGTDAQNSTDICQTGNGTSGTGSGETTVGCESVNASNTDGTCDINFVNGWNTDYFFP